LHCGADSPAERRFWVPVCAATIYGLLVAAAVWHHEPWADEAQAWLLARDCGIADLWTGLLKYEGTPGLWHTVLHMLTQAGAPYGALGITSGVLGLTAAWLLLRYAPLPLWIRVLLPFTYFVAYQYAVISRSYSLLLPLLLGCAITYRSAERHLTRFTVLCGLIAAVSVHGFILSVCIWLSFHYAAARRRNFSSNGVKRFAVAGALYVCALAFLAFSAWPASDVTFPYRRTFSWDLLFHATVTTFSEAFTGNALVSFAVTGLSLPFLRKGGGLVVFVLSAVLLCGMGAFIHVQVWHLGILFMAWLFAIWIAGYQVRLDKSAMAALVIVIATQCYWTARSMHYDWYYQYSGSREAARYLQAASLRRQDVFFAGYSSTAVQPYLSTDISGGAGFRGAPAYWRWAPSNHRADPGAVFSGPSPEYVLAGYSSADQRRQWSRALEGGGYKMVRHFEGNLFWRTHILEPESFDLYRSGERVATLASRVSMADPAAAAQLPDGFFPVESNAWRWTSRRFSVLLASPPGAGGAGATLELHLSIPETEISRGGRIKLSASVGDRALAPETFSKSGTYVYSRAVPADLLKSSAVTIHFNVDKSVPPSAADARELGVIVTQAGLLTRQSR
jgi:hypothetical protein